MSETTPTPAAEPAAAPAALRIGRFGQLARWKKLLVVFAAALVVAGVALPLFGGEGGGLPAAPVPLGSGAQSPQGVAASNLTGAAEAVPSPAGGSSGETGEAWAPGFLRMGLSFFVAFAIGAVFRMFFRLAIMFVGVLALTIIGLSQVDLVTVHWGNIEQLWGGFVDRIGEDFGQLRTTLTGSLPQAGLGTLGLVAGFKKG